MQLSSKIFSPLSSFMGMGVPLVALKNFDHTQISAVLGKRNKKYLLMDPLLQQRAFKQFLSLLLSLRTSSTPIILIVDSSDSGFAKQLERSFDIKDLSIMSSLDVHSLNTRIKHLGMVSPVLVSLFITDKTQMRYVFLESELNHSPILCLGNTRVNREFGAYQILGNFETALAQRFVLVMVFLALKKRKTNVLS